MWWTWIGFPTITFIPLYLVYRIDLLENRYFDLPYYGYTIIVSILCYQNVRLKVWPYLASTVLSMLLHVFVRQACWNDFWNTVICMGSFWTVDMIFMDRKEYNRPVYHLFSKKSMIGVPFLNFTPTKHSMIVLPSIDDKYIVLHVKGKVLGELTPKKELIESSVLERSCSHFYKVGWTSSKIVRTLLKKNKLKNAYFCQKYSNVSAGFICRPLGCSGLSTKLAGRMSFYVVFGFLGLISLINHLFLSKIFSFEVPFDLIFMHYVSMDFWSNELPPENQAFTISDLRTMVTSCALYFFLWYFGPMNDMNGKNKVLTFVVVSLISLVYLKSTIPRFGAYRSYKL